MKKEIVTGVFTSVALLSSIMPAIGKPIDNSEDHNSTNNNAKLKSDLVMYETGEKNDYKDFVRKISIDLSPEIIGKCYNIAYKDYKEKVGKYISSNPEKVVIFQQNNITCLQKENLKKFNKSLEEPEL
ncbi:MAG: hypothetical protein ACRBDI_01770 [Alphaproteobacteria bacterium]